MSDNQKILEKWDIILDIAIIGSGMAGLAAARILKDAGHTITIFEALPGGEWTVIALSSMVGLLMHHCVL